MNFWRPHRAAAHDDTVNINSFDVEDNEHQHTHRLSTWKDKAGRIYASIFRSRLGRRRRVAADTAPSPSSSSSSSSPSNTPPTNTSSNPSSSRPRRRRYMDVWITKDFPLSSSPSSGSRRRQAYRAAFKDRVVRKHLSICTVSCLLLLSMIQLDSIYGLHNASVNGQTYRVFFLLFIMILVIIFCHSLARTCILATSIARHGSCTSGNTSLYSSCRRIPSVAGPQGYAQPTQPIHVVLARDEEITLEAGESSDNNNKIAAPPPAYGLWRNSVRINPNLLYWQRVDGEDTNTSTPIAPLPTIHDGDDDDASQNEQRSGHGQQQTTQPDTETNTNTNTNTHLTAPNRPPSYASEDGVEYVVDAQPRSTVSQYTVAV